MPFEQETSDLRYLVIALSQIPEQLANRVGMDRVERLLDMSLDHCHTLLSIPVRATSAIELNAKIQVIRAVMMTAAKVGIERHRTEQQDREFEQRVREHEAKINALRRENILSPARE